MHHHTRSLLQGQLFWTVVLSVLSLVWPQRSYGMQYRPEFVTWNINVNKTASLVMDYTPAARQSREYTPSPANWRALPFYTVLLDRFADGDPSNNDFFNTVYESDPNEVNLRFGGDVKGLFQRLDYIQGMGIRAIFIAGTPFVNMPWEADGESITSGPCMD